jgi:hypothetical protein
MKHVIAATASILMLMMLSLAQAGSIEEKDDRPILISTGGFTNGNISVLAYISSEVKEGQFLQAELVWRKDRRVLLRVALHTKGSVARELLLAKFEVAPDLDAELFIVATYSKNGGQKQYETSVTPLLTQHRTVESPKPPEDAK